MRILLLALSFVSALAAQNLTAQAYADQGFGIMYSYGPAVFCCSGDEVAGTIPSASTFNPTNLDLDQWLDAAVLGKAKYVILTTKFTMGFALWPTAFNVSGTSYSIAQSSWYSGHGNYDIVGNFTTKARARGLRVGFYFSIQDRKYEALSGNTAASNSSAYTSMIETELAELLAYGPDFFWFDAWGWNSAVGNYTYIPFATIASYVHGIAPNCLVFDNSHAHPQLSGDVEIYEKAVDGLPPSGNTRPSEFDTAIQVNGSGVPDYSWVSGHSMFPAYRLAQEWSLSNARNTAFLLNFGPDTTGQLPSDQLATFREMLIYRRGTAWSVPSALGTTPTVSSTDSTDGTSASALTDGTYEPSRTSIPFSDIWAPTAYPAYAEIDLGSVLSITQVEAFNRTDSCCKGGFRNLTLTIYDNSHSTVYTGSTYNSGNALGSGCGTGPAVFTTAFQTSVSGRYVRITNSSDGGCGFALGEISVRTDPQQPGSRGQSVRR